MFKVRCVIHIEVCTCSGEEEAEHNINGDVLIFMINVQLTLKIMIFFLAEIDYFIHFECLQLYAFLNLRIVMLLFFSHNPSRVVDNQVGKSMQKLRIHFYLLMSLLSTLKI